jgi:hypothetical protein
VREKRVKRCRLFLVLVLLLMVSGLLLLPQVRWPLYGWLRGEAFYQGMPTSYWSLECERAGSEDQQSPIWFDRWFGWLGISRASNPRALSAGDPRAIPVCIELLQTQGRWSRWMGAYALGIIAMTAREPGTQNEAVQSALQAAVPILQEAARTGNSDVRREILGTLMLIDPAAARVTEDALDRAGYQKPKTSIP